MHDFQILSTYHSRLDLLFTSLFISWRNSGNCTAFFISQFVCLFSCKIPNRLFVPPLSCTMPVNSGGIWSGYLFCIQLFIVVNDDDAAWSSPIQLFHGSISVVWVGKWALNKCQVFGYKLWLWSYMIDLDKSWFDAAIFLVNSASMIIFENIRSHWIEVH
jgi:hypothetical protein